MRDNAGVCEGIQGFVRENTGLGGDTGAHKAFVERGVLRRRHTRLHARRTLRTTGAVTALTTALPGMQMPYVQYGVQGRRYSRSCAPSCCTSCRTPRTCFGEGRVWGAFRGGMSLGGVSGRNECVCVGGGFEAASGGARAAAAASSRGMRGSWCQAGSLQLSDIMTEEEAACCQLCRSRTHLCTTPPNSNTA